MNPKQPIPPPPVDFSQYLQPGEAATERPDAVSFRVSNETSGRDKGYYWVLYPKHDPEWIVAEWDGVRWWMPGRDDDDLDDSWFDEIGPKVPSREHLDNRGRSAL